MLSRLIFLAHFFLLLGLPFDIDLNLAPPSFLQHSPPEMLMHEEVVV